MIRTMAWTAALCLLAATAHAQAANPAAPDTQYFIDVSGGWQLGHHDVNSTVSFPLYGETATFNGSQSTANGFFIDVGVGYRFKPSLGVELAGSTFTSKTTATVTAQIPNPVFFDQPLTVNTTAADMTRTERAIHLRVVSFIPVSDQFEVALSAGPSVVKVIQDLPSGTVASGTQNVTSVAATESKTGIGLNIGFDATYAVTPNVGIGILAHYVLTSVDLTSATGVKAGGLQTGIGLHFRF